ncbi:Outer membrane receptor proteins, mostly Fe transport [Hymenobacter daecheongensis DSM 21074]|uniref:Outer membrane receptor proteins, mostly Fe transport n=1 Tax=Hymenobacter daecheongensis DSM 21074 TaxID=1121955 RepID=A0A1M6GXI5_9BACT|nr:TonB-dependent receptor [Hymenobacter daecheongensis]SHJ14698.1 Outer membrane receptor proteins, mostly Fe transport [Hymenobacter daecheongensis DSM 21074]
MFFRFTLLLGLWLSSAAALAQATGSITGIVRDRATQQTLPGVTVVLEGTQLGTGTDATGRYRLTGIPTGSYNLRASFIGYAPLLRANVQVNSGNANIIDLELSADAQQLGEVQVTANRATRVATAETPLSVQRINTEEIKSNPGGNFDISKVIQTLPGVGGGGTGGTSGFRNDIIIRGGAPNENVYYLDGIEVPIINHFQTQGSAGGPTGILNVSFIEDVTLSTSAFNARYDNALSSVLQFRQREGNPDRLQGNLRTSATEVAGTLEGPLTKNTTFLASARRSYLQLLFKALDLPIRPDYWDFQYKTTTRLGAKTTLTSLGIGAIDHFEVGVPKKSSPEKEIILRQNPTVDQWNYTVGVALRRLLGQGFLNVALSRTQLYNKLDQFQDGVAGDESRRILLTRSGETENKLRADVNGTQGRWQYSYGAVGQYVQYDNRFFNRVRRPVLDTQGQVLQPGVDVRFQSDLDFFRFGAFGQLTRAFLPGDRLTLSAGLRTDGNSFTEGGANLARTLSPRVSASYALLPEVNLNASVGRYYKIPPSTLLGFRDEAGNPVNQGNRYIRSDHYVAGVEWLPLPATRFTLEGFYKKYAHYPVSVRDGLSLANLGGDFAALGNEAVTSTGRGRAYGLEFFFQQKLTRKVFAVASLTGFRSEFTGRTGQYRPSAWDSRLLASALLGRKFNRGWEMGFKYRLAGGSPYTPYNLAASQASYLTTGRGVLDFEQLNTRRLGSFQQFDFRLDKRLNWRRLSLDLFLDVQNAFVLRNPALPEYTFQRLPDNSGFATTDGQPIRPDGVNAVPVLLDNNDPSVTPTIGFILEF